MAYAAECQETVFKRNWYIYFANKEEDVNPRTLAEGCGLSVRRIRQIISEYENHAWILKFERSCAKAQPS